MSVWGNSFINQIITCLKKHGIEEKRTGFYNQKTFNTM